ncbi:TRAP-type C4-dicarboxylate transport system permease small subunit [Neolewinella xylanilytica]|uniref:TRAP-type C4-dicarboxylate transport system permease small subunit n=1 Tax=Neolewinella xylanilytica TaxID=1514080 RepID=A0A2S6I4G0_9BACT|nr:TRAP transporter small permease [Neolewinella xylanilytica]PPK86060.1 TRAP-type C4-dicarboxylate transport system permease small subunit [Neolewinella xylanilytica]
MKDKVDKILGYVLVIMLAVMTLDVLWGVFTRYVMSNQASWSEEMARFLLIWIGILGAAYASGQRMHLSIDLLDNKPVKLIASLIILFALGVMVVGGTRLVLLTAQLGQLSPALGVPMSIIYSVVPISGLLIIYYRLSDFKAT